MCDDVSLGVNKNCSIGFRGIERTPFTLYRREKVDPQKVGSGVKPPDASMSAAITLQLTGQCIYIEALNPSRHPKCSLLAVLSRPH